jgi:alpha-galactosidase/6-phospho-beta-glucosidase family protein
MTFRKPRTAIGKTNVNNGDTWELIRFCNKKYTNVVGAASRLLKHFIREVNPQHIYSFADNRWSSPVNNLYLTCGFKHVSTSQHGYWYTKDYMNREHRFNYNKGVLKKMGMDTNNHTEVELMRNMGYHRVWDCGVTRFEMVL